MDYFDELRKQLKTYLDDPQIEQIYQAYLLAKQGHEGQIRRTGDPYITHPVAVALILARMHMDAQSIMAALMHDLLEDTAIDKATLARQFGQQVADLVDGVSKLTQIKFETQAEAQAENFRKMVLAMAQDIRVIIVKLADRLHNMRTLDALPPSKRQRIAIETLEIYAPIANRLGMHSYRVDLEELGFAALYPMRFRVINDAVQKARGNRKEIMSVIEKSLHACLSREGMPPTKLYGREKHLYSIYKKMRNKRIPFADIMDVYAFRITVDCLDSCYRVLGAVHNSYKPVPERFKDYIAIPKANGYQSLHTTLFGPYGVPIEIQIRTEEMHRMAESGIAAHWLYKADSTVGSKAHIRAQQWLKNLLEMQQSTGSSLEFIENVKIDLFPDEVYVFTPKGNILELPRGATAVDFAYAIHTEIGDTCVAAKIDRRLAPLSTPLMNGQNVEIVTSPSARPSPSWLNFVVTGKARSKIKHYFKKQKGDESIVLGRRLLDRALSTLNLSLAQIPEIDVARVLKESNYTSLNELLEDTGMGNQVPLILARRLACAVKDEQEQEEQEKKDATERLSQTPLLIKGTEGMVVSFAKCCYPLPGDLIVGILDAGRGIIVHRENCRDIAHLRKTEKCIFLSWEKSIAGDFQAEIRTELMNRKGTLASLAVALADMDANIENITVADRDGHYSEVNLIISVKDRAHLARVMRRVRSIPEVSKIMRASRAPRSHGTRF
jgi:RelA/SpoT family (p)ppGpp synthetase